MSEPFRVACVQLSSGREIGPNLEQTAELIRAARAHGADLIVTPETTDLIEPRGELLREKLCREQEHPGVALFCGLAEELSCWLLIGSLLVRLADGAAANRSYLFDATGQIAARYDKIHMFDVELPDGQTYRESRRFRSGQRAVIADLPWGRLGLSICYDLRFPHLYRRLAQAGAAFLTVPSAFTHFTGAAHWETLLRARAIETGCYVFAPAQCGRHAEGRETYGHSMVIGPWGEICAEAGEEIGIVQAVIDPAAVAKARAMVPAWGAEPAFSAVSAL